MNASVIFVAYATTTLDLSWIPDDAPVFVVHNDDSLSEDSCLHPDVAHIRPGANVGFGAGVNLALPHVTTERVVLCNPDMRLDRTHWKALDGTPNEMVTVPLVDETGIQTSVVAPYWTPTSLLLTVFRLGKRLAPLGSTRRRIVSSFAGSWAQGQQDVLQSSEQEWPLTTHWVSGALLSVDTARLQAVDGFDESFFLYFEDTDLCQRLAKAFPHMRVRRSAAAPGEHAVGGSATSTSSSKKVEDIRRRSALRYAQQQTHWSWTPYRVLAPVLS